MIKCLIRTALLGCVLLAAASQLRCDRTETKEEVHSGHVARPLACLDLVRMQQSGAFSTLPVETVEVVNDPAYKNGKKRFRGYSLQRVLAQAKLATDGAEPLKIHLLASDGYQTELRFAPSNIESAVLAFEDVEAPANEKWQSFRSGKRWMTPAPFYLVWPASRSQGKPWPYQLQRIEVWSGAAKDAAYPVNAPAARVGYQTFRAQCMSCHSVNLAGGSLGPELNVPKNVLEYRDTAFLQTFIRNAGAFHARSVMPPFEHLTPKELDSIIFYLRTMSRAKVCASVATCQRLTDGVSDASPCLRPKMKSERSKRKLSSPEG
ncbi:MAG: cytochrome c [Myxococcales bacterium]|nr:cytochrome c [Myxococcales bacterium]